MSQACPFCHLPPESAIGGNAHAFYFEDKYPVTPGHLLIVPRRHVATYFEATPDEKQALWALLEEAQAHLSRTRSPDGFNIGVNVGETAGQTVMHLHMHLIPRYQGDMADPRGGVRHVIPEKGKY
jgi:diadenosine tetraphosphate (Ap4A) HIT family hydrolase